LLTIICLSHAEDVANRATRRVPHDNHSTLQQAETDHPDFTVVLAPVFDLDGEAFEDKQGVLKIKAALMESLLSPRGIKGQAHLDSVSTETGRRKRMKWIVSCATVRAKREQAEQQRADGAASILQERFRTALGGGFDGPTGYCAPPVPSAHHVNAASPET
jgi:hypothetical protein